MTMYVMTQFYFMHSLLILVDRDHDRGSSDIRTVVYIVTMYRVFKCSLRCLISRKTHRPVESFQTSIEKDSSREKEDAR